MNCTVAICDDAAADRDYLQTLVKRWAADRGHRVELTLYPSAESFLFRYAEDKDVQILLLDIEMGPMDGVSLARTLRKENDAVQIVFITGYSDYIADGYEVEALHYLMKPVKEEKLFAVLDRAVEKLHSNQRTLLLELPGEVVRLPVYQIRSAEVQGNYVTIHAKTDCTVKMTLSELEAQLDDNFFRLGRSALVNLGCVARVSKTAVTLNDGTVLPLPRGAYERINRAIIQRG
ncbi:LytTR family DNA-binding domain-containing protein [uncultured Subdoligranulum sp.]|uniref:LytR/AlgR family response regulator transcription factor n=1 Tax=uncultured Subdoligranulum sp. TaxID=512298 RepID=UPI0025DEC6BA|nr:LytTR family DNA-binding domain-containing protein [uncultured Subdoligranulum sp.]